MSSETHPSAGSTRREFIRTSSAALVGSTLASVANVPGAWAAGSDEIRVGVIGCGGRGTGAIDNVLDAAEGVRIVALGDLFPDRIASCLERLQKHGERAMVPQDRQFAGWDAYEKVIATDANYIILATPPGFRPAHLKAAVAAGKHIFTEKPVAVDVDGYKMVLAAYEESLSRRLGIAAGTQRRHHGAYVEAMKRVKDGAIGEIVAARAYWNQGGLWVKPRQPGWSDMEYQLRNWLYYTWLSGDHIVEQHVHNLDVVNWAMGAIPAKVLGVGGRQARTEPEYGHIYDHFGLDYEYANGVHMMSMCRQQPGTPGLVAEALVGTLGTCFTQDGRTYEITGPNAWKWEGPYTNPYVQEHTDLIASIRAGNPINELKQVADSTFTAIAGRHAAYTGNVISFDELMATAENLMPAQLTFGPLPTPPVAVPGMSDMTSL
ncbi:MAG TPA: Gfo/Idh/MocA family oxidoreductase [Vicinamibacterales bacterium]|nr:Gfo/Idh/MocA family oxidoreductase [Vicinamibacterales bacterium]